MIRISLAKCGLAAAFLADLEGDGYSDLAVAHDNSKSVSVLLNIGGGMSKAAGAYPLRWYPESVVADDRDGDGDGYIYLASANCTSGKVSVVTSTSAIHRSQILDLQVS